jgi:hypothetical protein
VSSQERPLLLKMKGYACRAVDAEFARCSSYFGDMGGSWSGACILNSFSRRFHLAMHLSSSLSLPMFLLFSVLTLPSSHSRTARTAFHHQSALVASYISGSNELVLVSLKLLNTISHFGGGRNGRRFLKRFRGT